MFLKKIKYKSNASRHVILKKNFAENITFSKKIINTNKTLLKDKKKKTSLSLHKNKIYTCKLNLIPKNGFFCGGTKTFSTSNKSMGIFFNKNCMFFDYMPKGYDFFLDNQTSLITVNEDNYVVNGQYMYTYFLKYSSKVMCIYDTNYNKIYQSSAGNYCVFKGFIKSLNLSIFILPSKKKTYFPYISMCRLGRSVGVFNKYTVFGSRKFKAVIKKKHISTRGIAMNPVDHPNGGRTKSKTPFYNKYNNLAKKGK